MSAYDYIVSLLSKVANTMKRREHYYVVDVYSRRYYEQSFPTRGEALIAARAIPQRKRPFGVWIERRGIPRERTYAPIDDA
jgi:hypothetical protein